MSSYHQSLTRYQLLCRTMQGSHWSNISYIFLHFLIPIFPHITLNSCILLYVFLKNYRENLPFDLACAQQLYLKSLALKLIFLALNPKSLALALKPKSLLTSLISTCHNLVDTDELFHHVKAFYYNIVLLC